jgi:hypothetical protein
MVRSVLKKVFFAIYVVGVRMQTFFVPARSVAPAQTFIWKDSWFLLWHIFLWGSVRSVLARFTAIRPLACDRSSELMKHHQRFNTLARRDSAARGMEEKIMKPTRYLLAADTAKELCLLYGSIAAMAPWQYGLPARLRARAKMRYASGLSLVVFIGACYLSVPGLELFGNLILVSFLSSLVAIAGWRADSSLCRMAYEAERLQQSEEMEKT